MDSAATPSPRRLRLARLGKAVTVLMGFAMVASGLINVAGIEPPFAGAHELGYPSYVPPMLGVAKLLGTATFVMPGRSRLREWAYAGFTFELLGAAASHAFAGHGLLHVLPPLLDLSLVMTSYFLWHRARSEPDTHPPLSAVARRAAAGSTLAAPGGAP